jgi:hypothetical protein
MSSIEPMEPTVPEQIPLTNARLWLAPMILGILVLSLAFFLYLGPFWEYPQMLVLAIALLVVAATIGAYMYRWAVHRALTCAPEGLHVRGAGAEHVIDWAQVGSVEVAGNTRYFGSDNFALEIRRPDGSTVAEVRRFTFTDEASAQHARDRILAWRGAHLGAMAPGTGR